MVEFILFILTFVFAFALYYALGIRREYDRLYGIQVIDKKLENKELSEKKRIRLGKKKDKLLNMKMASDILYITARYKINVKKINYVLFLNILGVTNALFLAIIITLVLTLDNIFLQFLIAFVFFFVVIIFAYHIIGTQFKKREKK